MWKATYRKHTLWFKFDAGTSRGVLKEKDTWYISLCDTRQPEIVGIGECGPLKGLSIDDRQDFQSHLEKVCLQITGQETLPNLPDFPSIQFGLETALHDLQHGGRKEIFQNDFYSKGSPIPINGLVWMGTKEFMIQQVKEKLETGFSCIKLKVGALDFDTELEILKWIRQEFTENDIVLRLDANGAFSPNEALQKLQKLSDYQIQSIEQPIKAGLGEHMAEFCIQSPIPIALDEELIGTYSKEEKVTLLEMIKPQYIILKPTLLGGFTQSDEWIHLAEGKQIGWWITSALESNIGLNAICQYTFEKMQGRKPIPQGLGTGSLYLNNIDSPLLAKDGNISYMSDVKWGNIP